MLMTKKRSRPATPVRAQVAALHDDRRVEVAVDAPARSRCRGTPGNAISGGGAGSRVDDRDVLAERAQRVRHRQLRADRVAVRPRVRGEHEPLARADGVDDLLRSQDWSSSSVGVGVIGGAGAAARMLVQELLDAVLAGDRLVVDELQLGHALQPQPRADLAAQERRARARAPCALCWRAPCRRRARCRRPAPAAGRADLHARERDEADARDRGPRGRAATRARCGSDRRRGRDGNLGTLTGIEGPTAEPSDARTRSATRSIANTSMTSPTLRSLNLSKPMPHSKPGLDFARHRP